MTSAFVPGSLWDFLLILRVLKVPVEVLYFFFIIIIFFGLFAFSRVAPAAY